MYPYESRLQWLMSSRYNHILRALELAPHPTHDSLLQERADSLRRWDRTRAVVLVLLYLGAVGAGVLYAANFIPGLGTATPLLSSILRATGALTGLFTLAYLLLTRLLSQIEADILMLMATNAQH